ncbi:inositol monophosphatase family protein [Amphibacillus sediminis]|uniref:inositol monophosphatase family protein n=1 Tax=Amphibacillus sediminis TaxID=360185 RepID=UPI0008313B73|nr:inositol monophosphatase family protein [Amphibacillus sediminis]
MTHQEIYQLAKEWTYEAGEILRKAVTEQLTVEYKTSAADLVTEKDKEIERFFANKINQVFPTHFLLGEEGVQKDQAYQPEEETVWIVDPIDGTTNFVHTKANFSISVAVYVKGEPVIGIIYDVIKDEMFHVLVGAGLYINDRPAETALAEREIEEALICINHLWLAPNPYINEIKMQKMVGDIRGFRCIGSAALELAYVATGRMDGAIFNGLGPWDYAAGYVMLKEQGLVCTTTAGDVINPYQHSPILAASQALHTKILNDYIELKN